MDAIYAQAVEIVKAQASTRAMTAEEITSMIRTISASITAMMSGAQEAPVAQEIDFEEAKKAVKEKSVVCMECGKSFKVLTKRHLATHGLTAAEYREKWGYKKGASLVAKSLARDRRKKMQDMKLWEKRKAALAGPGAGIRNPAQAEIE